MFHFFLNDFFLNNDFIGPLGTYDFPFLSGAPRERSNYLSIIKPFDNWVWASTWGSTVAVTFALLLINVVYSIFFEGKEVNWTNEVAESMLYLSIKHAASTIINHVPTFQLFCLHLGPFLTRPRAIMTKATTFQKNPAQGQESTLFSCGY